MPKVYADGNQRQKAKIIRILCGATKGKQKDLAERWGISQPAVSQRLNNGNITLFDLWQAKDLIAIDSKDIMEMIGKE